MKDKYLYLFPAALLAAGLIICSIIIASTWRQNNSAGQTLTVTGSAKKEIIADLGFLRGTISAQAPNASTAFNQMESQKPALLSYLASKGFPRDKVTFFTVNTYPIYELAPNGAPTSNIIAYSYTQRLEISSGDVQKIKEISLDITSIVNKGVNFVVEMPEYHYTRLAELKIQIQAEAARDALNRAKEIAKATGRDLGPLRNARMGVLQITPRFSNMISDYGVNDVTSIEKEITAVVTASFEIE